MRKLLATILALTMLYGAVAFGNYTATQGSGLSFGSVVVASTHYAQQLICDLVTPAQCAAVDASGNLSVKSSTLSTAANQTSELTKLDTLNTSINSPIPTCGTNPCTNAIGVIDQRSQYPAGATAITASATGTTAATTATLAGTSGKTTYICWYSIRANATAATTVTNTITGVINATLSSVMWVAPLASGLGIDEQIFSPCIPASATNTGIAIVSGAPGSGGTVTSKGGGYQL